MITDHNTDLTYSTLGLFTLFIPETKAGEDAWRQIAAVTDGTGKILTAHLPSILQQLRITGYTVRKARPVKMKSPDSMLAELGL